MAGVNGPRGSPPPADALAETLQRNEIQRSASSSLGRDVTQLRGATALVTGGTTGIGLAAAQRLAAEGAHVFLTGHNRRTLHRWRTSPDLNPFTIVDEVTK